MKIIAIDAIDINSFGGLIHLDQVIKILSKKKIFLKIYSNSFVNKNLKKNKNIKLIKKKLFDKNFIYRHFWKFLFLKKELEKGQCSLLLSLNGIYHGLFRPTILVQQNILPFDILTNEKYNFILRIKFFFQKIAIIISIVLHKNIIFTSYDIKKKILKYFKKKNFFRNIVIYHGVKKGQIVKKNFFYKQKIKLLYISEFQKYKNHDKLFNAIKNSQNQNISLDCIGRYEEKYLNKLNTKYNFKKLNIRVRKNISYKDIIKTYKNYDALIFPSLCESFGLPVLEAAANNLPVLCSDLKVFREIYGEGCFYFDPRSSKSILNKIYYFISLKKNEIIKKTKLNYIISKNLNWNFCGNNYYKTILDTLNFYEKKN